jgi:hypothetical protein
MPLHVFMLLSSSHASPLTARVSHFFGMLHLCDRRRDARAAKHPHEASSMAEGSVMTKRYSACCCCEGDEEKCSKKTDQITQAARRRSHIHAVMSGGEHGR